MVVVVRVAPGATERAFAGDLDRQHGRRAGEDSAPGSEEAAGVHVFAAASVDHRGPPQSQPFMTRAFRAITPTARFSGGRAVGATGEQNGRQDGRRKTATNQSDDSRDFDRACAICDSTNEVLALPKGEG